MSGTEQILAALAALVLGATPIILSWLKVKLGPQRMAAVNQLASIAVNASEKLGEAIPDATSGDKYLAASEFLRDAAKRVGVKLTDAEANGFIQSALRSMQQAGG